MNRIPGEQAQNALALKFLSAEISFVLDENLPSGNVMRRSWKDRYEVQHTIYTHKQKYEDNFMSAIKKGLPVLV